MNNTNLPRKFFAGKLRPVKVIKTKNGPVYVVKLPSSLGFIMTAKAWERAVMRGDALPAGVVNSNRTKPATPAASAL